MWCELLFITEGFLGQEMDLLCGSAGKESACKVGDLDLIRGEGKGYSLLYSGLENSRDCVVPGVAKSQTRLSNFHFRIGDRLFKAQ